LMSAPRRGLMRGSSRIADDVCCHGQGSLHSRLCRPRRLRPAAMMIGNKEDTRVAAYLFRQAASIHSSHRRRSQAIAPADLLAYQRFRKV
jgi:hypothetical protein